MQASWKDGQPYLPMGIDGAAHDCYTTGFWTNRHAARPALETHAGGTPTPHWHIKSPDLLAWLHVQLQSECGRSEGLRLCNTQQIGKVACLLQPMRKSQLGRPMGARHVSQLSTTCSPYWTFPPMTSFLENRVQAGKSFFEGRVGLARSHCMS